MDGGFGVDVKLEVTCDTEDREDADPQRPKNPVHCRYKSIN